MQRMRYIHCSSAVERRSTYVLGMFHSIWDIILMSLIVISLLLLSSGQSSEQPNDTQASLSTHEEKSSLFHGYTFYTFFKIYLPSYLVIGLLLSLVGVLFDMITMIVLTRPSMAAPIYTILCAIAFSNFVVHLFKIAFFIHALLEKQEPGSYDTYGWALYLLIHTHIYETGLTFSVWLTCLLSIWRYYVVCRLHSPNQRQWSVFRARSIVAAIAMIVPVLSIPNYLTLGIREYVDSRNRTAYIVAFSDLAQQRPLLKASRFWISSCFTNLLPWAILTFHTCALEREMVRARVRRLRLANHSKTIDAQNAVSAVRTLRISMDSCDRLDVTRAYTFSHRDDCDCRHEQRQVQPSRWENTGASNSVMIRVFEPSDLTRSMEFSQETEKNGKDMRMKRAVTDYLSSDIQTGALPRSISACGALDAHGGSIATTDSRLFEIKPFDQCSRAASMEFSRKISSIGTTAPVVQSQNTSKLIVQRAVQRQLSQNETTTRLLITVMVLCLVSGLPAGFLSAFTAINDEKFYRKVYQPLSHMADLLCLIQSTVNFIIYCMMSTQFRRTLYEVFFTCYT